MHAFLFEVQEAFKRTLLLGFRAYIREYTAFCLGSRETPAGGLQATDAGPLIISLVSTT